MKSHVSEIIGIILIFVKNFAILPEGSSFKFKMIRNESARRDREPVCACILHTHTNLKSVYTAHMYILLYIHI